MKLILVESGFAIISNGGGIGQSVVESDFIIADVAVLILVHTSGGSSSTLRQANGSAHVA
jgi:hypothetical protein